ncbi:VOC family protein, partial [Paraburkholderia sp. GAS334]
MQWRRENRTTTKPLTLGIDHIGLTVRNLNLTRDFFISCLG